MLPVLRFLPPWIDRYLDVPFRLPGSGWAWVIAVGVGLLQIWVSWAYVAAYILCVLVMWMPLSLPLPQYRFPAYYFSGDAREDQPPGAVYVFYPFSYKGADQQARNLYRFRHIVNSFIGAWMIMTLLVVALLPALLILLSISHVDIWNAGFPDYLAPIFDMQYLAGVRTLFEQGKSSDWHTVMIKLLYWPIPSLMIWVLVL